MSVKAPSESLISSGNPFEEFSDDDDSDSIDTIAEDTKNKTLDEVQQALDYQEKTNNEMMSGNNRQASNAASDISDSFTNIGYTGSIGNVPDKIIKVSDDEVYYYYGSLNNSRKRDGHGRTAMKNGMTAYGRLEG